MGRLAYIVGLALAVAAFGGFTFRPGGRWGLGRERQAWDSKAVLSIAVTFILIIATGYLGSFIVLVPEAQTSNLSRTSVFSSVSSSLAIPLLSQCRLLTDSPI